MQDGYSLCFNQWALDKDIKNELGLLLIISSLCAEKGYCYASNDYFMKLFEVDESTISRKLKKLEEKNYIKISYKKEGSKVIFREVRLAKKSMDRLQKSQWTVCKKVKENNISKNNISIKKKEIYKEIIFYLNQAANKNYKSSSTQTQKHINARLEEGYTIEDFKKVIDKKCNEWLYDSKMNNYLRPETLFGTKFESYLNQSDGLEDILNRRD